MEKKNKKNILFGMIVLILVTITLLGLTYAYYRTRVIGNDKTSISVSTKNLELTYHDGNSYLSMEGNVEPGFYATKDFSVENTGESSLNYDIVMDNIVNTFSLENSWKYILYKVDSDSKEKLTEGYIDDYFEILTLNSNILINPTEIINFQVYIEYVDSGEDQSVDMGSKLSLRVNIRETSKFELAEEGTLLYAIREGNDVVKTESVPGQGISGLNFIADESSAYENSIEITGEKYFAYSDSYTLDEKSGVFYLDEPISVIKYSTDYSKLNGKYVASVYGSDTEERVVTTNGWTPIFYKVISATTTSINYKQFGQTIKNVDEALMSITEDDYGTSYYFRGNVQNNYLNYAGMCWRIVRVDGNGNIKIILTDKNNLCEEGVGSADWDLNDGRFRYNSKSTKDGFLFENSEALETLTAWMNGGNYTYFKDFVELKGTFDANISAEDQEKLVVAEWCNDVSVASISETGDISYGSAARLDNYLSANPTLKCDMTGLNDSKAIKVRSKIGLLTADELTFSGLRAGHAVGSNSFLSAGGLTISAYGGNSDGTSYRMQTHDMWGTGYLDMPDHELRPAVVLKNDVEITVKDVEIYGEAGTSENPYVVS